MRWPNRQPHKLTPGMRRAQAALAGFVPLIDWPRLRRRNLTDAIRISSRQVAAFACGDETHAVIWLLRKDVIGKGGMLRRDAAPITLRVDLPGLAPGLYRVTAWDTSTGTPRGSFEVPCGEPSLAFETLPFTGDLALAVRRVW
jgi:mannan endo-1,4-beta-mannosidase